MGKLAKTADGHFDRANTLHREAIRAGVALLDVMAKCGRELLRAKKLVPHGRWVETLKVKFHGTPRTAQRYMEIARNPALVERAKEQKGNKATMAEVLKQIAGPDKKPADKSAENKAEKEDEPVPSLGGAMFPQPSDKLPSRARRHLVARFTDDVRRAFPDSVAVLLGMAAPWLGLDPFGEMLDEMKERVGPVARAVAKAFEELDAKVVGKREGSKEVERLEAECKGRMLEALRKLRKKEKATLTKAQRKLIASMTRALEEGLRD